MPGPFDVVTEVVARVFAKCECVGCDKFSLGIVCGRCSRHVCLRHGYVTLGAPPESVCAACTISDHRELLRFVQPPQTVVAQVEEADDVVDADFVGPDDGKRAA